MSPSRSKKQMNKKEHLLSSRHLSKNSKLNEPHPKRELDEKITNQSAKATSTEDNLKKLESLNKRVDFLGSVSIVIYICIFMFSLESIFMEMQPDKVMGVELYTCVLISHSFSFFSLFIVHYQLLPPLFDERCTVSSKIQGLMPFSPAYHRSKDELFWCYMRILLAILTDGVMWFYLNNIHAQYAKSNPDKLLIYCMLSGVLITFISFYVLAKIGPAGTEAILEQELAEQREDAIDGVDKDARYYNLLQEKDKILMELLNEKENEIKRLREELEETKNRTN